MSKDVDDLWNELPKEERLRLNPYLLSCQIRHFKQARTVAVRAHMKYLADLDSWIAALEKDLKRKGYEPKRYRG
ncbi:MAG: hypothetical protein AAF098_19500 [Pseudomonadota bacterium]